MAKGLEDALLKLLGDPKRAAGQADLLQAAALARQERALRQRAGAAAARLRRARAEGADDEEIATLEAALAARGARLEAAQLQAAAADVKRPAPDDDRAQVFARATGEIEAPPLTLAALGRSGKAVVQATASERGIAHLVADGPLEEVVLQFSDAKGRALWRAPGPVTVAAGETYNLDVDLAPPKPAPGPVPKTPAMPDLVGQNDGVAQQLLERLGVTEVKIEAKQADGQPDIVIAQAPEPGTRLTDKTAVTLTVRRATGGADTLHVPGLIGARVEEAEARLKALGLKAEVKRQAHDGPAGRVLAQDPEEGRPIKPGATVALTVSQAADDTPRTAVVPDLAGQGRDMAEAMLKAAGLRAEARDVAERDRPAGVVAQDPAAGTTVPRGSTVKLAVNTPPATPAGNAILPNLEGRMLADAQRMLKALNLSPEVTREVDAAPKDEVLAQEPAPGTRLAPGSDVALRVSDGPRSRGGTPDGLARLSRAMALDPRAEEMEADDARIAGLLRAGGAEDLDQARALAELEPEALRDRLKMSRLKDAKSFRAMLRKSLKDMG